MQDIQQSSASIIQNTKTKIQENLLEVEQEIENAFLRINKSIDILFLLPQPELPQIDQFFKSGINYTSQIVERDFPLINKMTQNQLTIQETNVLQTKDPEQSKIQEKLSDEGDEINKQNQILKEVIEFNESKILQADNLLIEENYEIDIQQSKDVIQVDNQQIQMKQQLMIQDQLELQLIDDSNKQISNCYALAFDKTGLIMISGSSCSIKIWNFDKGIFKLSNTYEKHKNPVSCLVYSQERNSFISGCGWDEIICWQQINEKEWKCSQPISKHNGQSIKCLILNKQEDQLISGGMDHQIIVWQVDFMNNQLTFLYSLNKHSNSVNSLSFNQSETLLASCGYHEFILWEKKRGQWKFKYILEQVQQLNLLTHLKQFIIKKVRMSQKL